MVEQHLEQQHWLVMPSPIQDLFFMFSQQVQGPQYNVFDFTTNDASNFQITIPSTISPGSLVFLFRESDDKAGSNTQDISGWTKITEAYDGHGTTPTVRFSYAVFFKIMTPEDIGSILSNLSNQTSLNINVRLLEIQTLSPPIFNTSKIISGGSVAGSTTQSSITKTASTGPKTLIIASVGRNQSSTNTSYVSVTFTSNADKFNEISLSQSDYYHALRIFEYYPSNLSSSTTIECSASANENSSHIMSVELW
jgi:hypothetical protein